VELVQKPELVRKFGLAAHDVPNFWTKYVPLVRRRNSEGILLELLRLEHGSTKPGRGAGWRMEGRKNGTLSLFRKNIFPK
jgi:hypothetical protein